MIYDFIVSDKYKTFRKWASIVLGGLIFLLVLASVFQGTKNGFRLIDFQWKPVKIMMSGENPYLYSLNKIPFAGGPVDANQVPSCLLLLAPFAMLSYQTATVIWAFLNLFFTGAFGWYFYRSFKSDRLTKMAFLFLGILLLLSTPWRVLVGNGQHLLFSLSFFMASYYFAKRERWFTSGILLALSAFKYTTIAPMAFIFILMKWWKPIVVAAIFHILATLGCALYLNESPLLLIQQSLRVGSMLLGQGDADIVSVLVAFDIRNVSIISLVSYGFFSLLLLVLAVTGNKRDTLLKLSIFAIISLTMFYHRIYDFIVLLFPLLLICRDWKLNSRVDKMIRWVTILNVGFVFYAIRMIRLFPIMSSQAIYTLLITTSTLVLLILLIVKDFSRNKMNEKGGASQ